MKLLLLVSSARYERLPYKNVLHILWIQFDLSLVNHCQYEQHISHMIMANKTKMLRQRSAPKLHTELHPGLKETFAYLKTVRNEHSYSYESLLSLNFGFDLSGIFPVHAARFMLLEFGTSKL